MGPNKNYFNRLLHYLSRSSNYYSEETFNKYVKGNSIDGNDFSLIHSYIRSIPTNLTNLTNLTPSNFDVYGIDGYNHVGLPRESGRGGGVSLFMCDKFMYTGLPEFCIVNDYIKCVFVKICHMSQTLIVGVVYRPPNSNIADFNNYMHFVLEKIACKPCYIMGDLNRDLLKYELHPPTKNFVDTMYASSLIPLINRPTSD